MDQLDRLALSRKDAVFAFGKYNEKIGNDRTNLWEDYVIKRELFLFEFSAFKKVPYRQLEVIKIEREKTQIEEALH